MPDDALRRMLEASELFMTARTWHGPGWELDRSAEIYVPYTAISMATRIFLASPFTAPCPVTMVDVSSNEFSYWLYLRKAWAQRKTFINFEHDVVPFPGAIQELLNCPRSW